MYAQRYLSELAYRFNRRFDLPDVIPRLAHVALRTPPMPGRLLELNLKGGRQPDDIGVQRFGFAWNVGIAVGRWGVFKRHVEQGPGAPSSQVSCVSVTTASCRQF